MNRSRRARRAASRRKSINSPGCWGRTRHGVQDYYSTLGLQKGATEKEIKQAFRKLARKPTLTSNPGDKSAEASSRRSTRPTRSQRSREAPQARRARRPTGGAYEQVGPGAARPGGGFSGGGPGGFPHDDAG